MNYRASRVEQVILDDDRTIESGGTITVFGILVANATASAVAVEVQDIAGTANMTIVVPAGDTRLVDVEWVADRGLQFSSVGSVNVIATVFHSGPSS